MKFTAEITTSETTGDAVQVTLSNVRRENAPGWNGYCPDIKIEVPVGQSRNFTVGRTAFINVELERIR